MWGIAERAHPKRANDDSLLYTSSVQWMYDQKNKKITFLVNANFHYVPSPLSFLVSLSQLCTPAWQRRIHKLRISKTAWICCCSVTHCGRARDRYICLHPSFSGSFSLYPHPLFIPSSSHQPLRTHTHTFSKEIYHTYSSSHIAIIPVQSQWPSESQRNYNTIFRNMGKNGSLNFCVLCLVKLYYKTFM